MYENDKKRLEPQAIYVQIEAKKWLEASEIVLGRGNNLSQL
jgi:hypothetical protein